MAKKSAAPVKTKKIRALEQEIAGLKSARRSNRIKMGAALGVAIVLYLLVTFLFYKGLLPVSQKAFTGINIVLLLLLMVPGFMYFGKLQRIKDQLDDAEVKLSGLR